MDVLVIYQFCSFGGVERFILNRAEAFKKHVLDVTLFVGYVHDYGALSSFKEYIHLHQLDEYIHPFLIAGDSAFHDRDFPLVLVIDTPQVLGEYERYPNVFVECHTPYKENREYLKVIPDYIRGIIVPTNSFRSIISTEYPSLPPIHVIPYSIPEDFFNPPKSRELFTRRPLTYLARLDALKNYMEVLDLFERLKGQRDILHIIIGQEFMGESIYQTLTRKGLLENTILRSRADFARIPALIGMVKQHKGIFISASRGESCGLSAAEFICGGVPVLLSDIAAHRELVDDDERFLYPLGNLEIAEERIIELLKDWEALSPGLPSHGNKFKSDHFIHIWTDFINSQNNL
jgi:glycosyltransferase involved in cell wall biosynthesis